jgi:hypothetical protein
MVTAVGIDRFMDHSWRDMSEYAVHLTKPAPSMYAFGVLWEIVTSGYLRTTSVCKGGLHKIEPSELGNVSAEAFLERIAGLREAAVFAEDQMVLLPEMGDTEASLP